MTLFLTAVLVLIVIVMIVLNQKILRSSKDEDQNQDPDGPHITNINRLFMQSTIAFLAVAFIVICWIIHLILRVQH